MICEISIAHVEDGFAQFHTRESKVGMFARSHAMFVCGCGGGGGVYVCACMLP